MHTVPAHMYETFVSEVLKKKHGYFHGLQHKVVERFRENLDVCYHLGKSPEECAEDMHIEWSMLKPVFKRPCLSDHVKSGVCVGHKKIGG